MNVIPERNDEGTNRSLTLKCNSVRNWKVD